MPGGGGQAGRVSAPGAKPPILGEVRDGSDGQGGHPDKFSRADAGEDFEAHGAVRCGPLIVEIQHLSADEADDGLVIGKDADDIGAALYSLLRRPSGLVLAVFGQG
jgi:hypothetical protein